MLLQSLFGIGPFCVLHLMWLRGSASWRVLLRLSRRIPPVHALASLRGRGSPPFFSKMGLVLLIGGACGCGLSPPRHFAAFDLDLPPSLVYSSAFHGSSAEGGLGYISPPFLF